MRNGKNCVGICSTLLNNIVSSVGVFILGLYYSVWSYSKDNWYVSLSPEQDLLDCYAITLCGHLVGGNQS